MFRRYLPPIESPKIPESLPISGVVDGRVVARMDDPRQQHWPAARALQGMQLLTRKEDHVTSIDRRLHGLSPHHPLAGEHDEGLFIEVAMRQRLAEGYLADELS